ncbi:TetR/AcrR family transcriptional regulator [Parafrankia discariae]|uniref:TetR/AcrR family transcriptional regulator n=1 Tax=Parafrankia discariae TaxID=365528 RepID=UPI000363D1CD|nr:TetR/AcrR family transcriptional regulator [Parafrankia discariae]
MTSPRRVGAVTSKTRALLLDCAENLMLEQGYAAVTYRGVAAQAEVTAGLVQYYFPTLEDLLVALVRRGIEHNIARLATSLETSPPLRAVWEHAGDRTRAALMAEFMALANHHKTIRAELAKAGEQARELALAAVSERSGDYGRPAGTAPPEALIFLMISTPRMIAMEETIGLSTFHAETIEFIERYLDEVEPRAADSDRAPKTAPATMRE